MHYIVPRRESLAGLGEPIKKERAGNGVGTKAYVWEVLSHRHEGQVLPQVDVHRRGPCICYMVLLGGPLKCWYMSFRPSWVSCYSPVFSCCPV